MYANPTGSDNVLKILRFPVFPFNRTGVRTCIMRRLSVSDGCIGRKYIINVKEKKNRPVREIPGGGFGSCWRLGDCSINVTLIEISNWN